MSCQASVPAVMKARKTGKVARRLALSIGLLCSKTFDDAIFPELFEAKYGLARAEITKINIKGVFQIWTRDGGYHEVPLKEGHAWTREGCKSCPDFAAEHADISTGGIGAFSDWTLTIVRTDQGRDILAGMVADGVDRDAARRRRPRRARAAAQAGPGAAGGGGPRPRWTGPAWRRRSLSPRRPVRRSPRTGRQARQDAGPVEHGVEHGLGEPPGEGVLLARVVRAQHDAPVGRRGLDAVAEAGPGSQAELVGHHLVGELAEGDHDPHARRAAPSSRCRKGRHAVALLPASACSAAVRTGRRRST